MKNIILIAVALTLAAAAYFHVSTSKQYADTIITNAKVYTVDARNSVAEAIAVRGTKILAVGSSKELTHRFASKNIIDLNGRTVIPGFIDSHAHVLGLGESLTELSLVGTTSAQEVVRRVAEKVKASRPGEWIRGRGWDQNDWGSSNGEKSFPTAGLLDKVSPDNPVILSRIDGHAIWVNSSAMKAAGVIDDTKLTVEGGKILRTSSGKPSGIFIDNAEQVIRSAVPAYSRSEKMTMYDQAFRKCLSVGITGVHDMGIDREDFEIYRDLLQSNTLPVRIYALIGGPGLFLTSMLQSGPYSDKVNHLFTVRGIKLYADGALGSRGAALLTPYDDDPSNTGLLTTEKDTIRSMTESALAHGFQVCVHAIGDRANRLVLDAFESAGRKYPQQMTNARLRVEHAQVISPEDIHRFKKLHIVPSMQPTHATSDMYWAQARLGPDRIHGAYAWRTLLDDGNIIPAGSDFPVEDPNPLYGFYAAITRQDKNGIPNSVRDVLQFFQVTADGIDDPDNFDGGWFVHQRMTREEALRAFTMWGAYAEFAESMKGSIEPGKFADLIVLSKDIMTIPPKEILTSEVELTMLGGQIHYRKSSDANSTRR